MPHLPRTLRRTMPLLVLAASVSFGCSNVAGVRSADSRKIQTFAAIGDKPLPTVTGTPGQTVVAEAEPERKPNPRGQISGRVVDSHGDPVPNAQVRVAIDGANTGRTGRVRTDDAGRFTLNGLRSGGDYTLIAETEDDEGAYLEGRIVAEAPEKQVKITLRPLDEELPARSRVGRVSERTSVEEDANTDADTPRINVEDLPPANEEESVEAISEASTKPTRRAGGWHGSEEPQGKLANAEPPLNDEQPDDGPLPIRDSYREEPKAAVDGPNPLPPALERPESTTAEIPFTALPEQNSPRPLDGFAPAPTSATPPPSSADPVPATTPPADSVFESAPAEPAKDVSSATAAPPSTESTPPSPTPEAAPSAEPAPLLEATEPAPAAEPPPAAEPIPAAEPSPITPAAEPPALDTTTEQPVPELLPEESPAPEAAVTRPKWGDLAKASYTPAPPVAAAVGETPKPKPRKRWFFSEKPAEAAPADNALKASCEFSAKDRRLVDFRLADLNGSPVSFQDLGADLVLLDFWGSWCGPCLNSIPKLIELQNRYPESKFKVVGIAYEHEGDLNERVGNVRRVAAELGVPYKVLLGEADGKACPLKEALHVQVYPTMILLDRQGNIVWRDQGVGPNTFARLERILASRAGQEIARR